MTIRRYAFGLTLALVLLLGMRLPLLRCEPFVPGTPLLFDEKDYIRGAKAMAVGDNSNDTFEAWMRAPATAWLLLTTAQIRGVPVELATCDFQHLQIGLWAVLLLLVSSIASMLFDRRVALISAMLVALQPIGVGVTLMVHADTLFAVGFVGTVWALLRYARSQRLAWVIVAGGLAGVAALTRSPILPLMPLFMLWVAIARWKSLKNFASPSGDPQFDRPTRSHMLREGWQAIGRTPRITWLRLLIPALVLFGCTALVLTPWTVRNYRLYGGFIPSDTTGAVNLFDNNAPKGHVSNTAVRESSDNPAERQRFAMRQAWVVISAEPWRVARKVIYTGWLAWSPEDFDLTLNFYNAMFERPLLATLFAQLTVLLWLAIPLAILALLCAPHTAAGATDYRLLIVGIALVYTAMMGITHFEERFRIPYLLLWLPYAAWSLAHPRMLLAQLRRPAGKIAGVLVVVLSISYISVLWPMQWDNARALILHARGLLRANWNDIAGALADQRAAMLSQPRFTEAQLAAAQLQVRQGDLNGAEQTLRAALEDAKLAKWRQPANATVALQQVLLAQGRLRDSAALDGRLEPPIRRRAETIAWRKIGSPKASLQLGQEDLGLVSGFYSANEQQDFRWSRPQAQILLAGQGDYVCLYMSAARPPDIAAPIVSLVAKPDGGSAVALGQLHPPRNGWAWLCAALPNQLRGTYGVPIEIDLQVTSYNPFMHGQRDARDLGLALQQVALRSGPLDLDPASGILLDQVASSVEPSAGLQLIGMNGAAQGQPGTNVPITLWWRGAQPPPVGAFTFLHLLDASGQTVAVYNAPLAGDQRPSPWVASEPLLDPAAIPLPATLVPGRYHLIGGAFDPTSGARLAQADLGELIVAQK